MGKINDIVKLVVCIVICQLAGALGSIFTFSSIPSWYATLAKPSFNPPGWVFGPVWGTLYTMMGVAAWLIWRKGVSTPGVRSALILFALQLALNAAWSPIFFGARQILWAFVVIVALWVAILLTTVAFWRHSRPAAVLLMPYLAWVSFASVLNFTLWRLNA